MNTTVAFYIGLAIASIFLAFRLGFACGYWWHDFKTRTTR